MNRILKLIRSERGNAVVEMGFIIPILTVLLTGTVEIARAYSTKLQIEQAAQRSIEWVQVSDFKVEDIDTLKTDAAEAADVATTAVTVDAWVECDGARQATYSDTCDAAMIMTRYVTVEIDKTYTPFFQTEYFPGADASGNVPLSAIAGVRVQ